MQASIMSLTRQQALRLTAALFAPLLLAAALIPVINAQPTTPPPHWFWGWDYDDFSGAVVVALDQDGDEVNRTTINAAGQWELTVDPRSAQSVTLELRASAGVYLSGEFTVEATIDRLVLEDDFVLQAPPEPEVEEPEEIEVETIGVRIVARRTEDSRNRIEFGFRNPDNEEIFPRARFFPEYGFGHPRWVSSSLIDFGDGFEARIIARSEDRDGCIEAGTDGRGCRTEFGIRIEGHEDIFPRQRFFFRPGSPDHNRFASSNLIQIPRPISEDE